MARLPKSAGLWAVDVAWEDDRTDERKIDVYAAREWFFTRLEELEDEAEGRGEEKPRATACYGRLAAEYLELPADQWPNHRAAVFWNGVFDVLAELKKGAAG